MGHASRSVPVIKTLLEQGHTVHVTGDGTSLDWLSAEFPQLEVHRLPKTNFRYPTSNMLWNAATQLFSFVRFIRQDKKNARMISRKINADAIISDNRFFFFDKKVPINIYITHQVHIYYPNAWLSRILTAAHQFVIKQYTSCWIPDDPEVKLAGLLSDAKGINHLKYIGIQSRFTSNENQPKTTDILVVLSGPEPQRSYLENELLAVLNQLSDCSIRFVRGTNLPQHQSVSPLINMVNILGSDKLETWIDQSKLLICRPGYSTLMDLYFKNKEAILIPTPGQTEQEYLCEYHSVSEGKFTPLLQKNIAGQLPGIISKKLAERHSSKE
ncbi:MAG: glycosyltransferase [Saprospiraceae bacterium]|nr:glycosyltransferase [Saprospiraceae bacterium]